MRYNSVTFEVTICDLKFRLWLLFEITVCDLKRTPGRQEMAENFSIIPVERIERSILLIRGQKVILDEDLAGLYEVDTKNLTKSIKRNADRFPNDFMFQISQVEFDNLRFQIGTSRSWGGQPVPSLRLHRAGRGHAFERPAKPARRAGEHRDHASVCEAAANAGVQRRTPRKAAGPGTQVRLAVPHRLRRDTRIDGAFRPAAAAKEDRI